MHTYTVRKQLREDDLHESSGYASAEPGPNAGLIKSIDHVSKGPQTIIQADITSGVGEIEEQDLTLKPEHGNGLATETKGKLSLSL